MKGRMISCVHRLRGGGIGDRMMGGKKEEVAAVRQGKKKIKELLSWGKKIL